MDPRPAATVIVARPGPPRGVEVLVLRRSAISRFAPGFVVFPGGTVEDDDASRALAWFGSADEAARVCALRELAEETGLVLTGAGLTAAPGALPGDLGLPAPVIGRIHEIARWIAPEFLPVRFDARFFALAADHGLDPRPDGVETDLAWWARPQDVLAASRAGTVQLLWPTLKMLEALAVCGTVQDVLDLRVDQVGPPLARP
jgi:8-oxo-dGTP pyrophosphatase MutT (NUDIX family)